MKAMLLHELGGRVTLGEVPVPVPGSNEALIKVRATGVGLGPEVDGWRKGDRVTCHFYLTCKVCKWCRMGKETLCPNFRGYVGMACDGAYAEYMKLPAVNLCRIPDNVS